MTQLEHDEAEVVAHEAKRIALVAGVGLGAAVEAINRTMVAAAADARQAGLIEAAIAEKRHPIPERPKPNRAQRRHLAKQQRRNR